MTDNGPCFTSSEFEQFLLKSQGFFSDTELPHNLPPGDHQQFLFRYRITPQSTTGRSPAELMFGRPLRSRLDLLFPDIQHRVVSQQEKQKAHHDQHCRHRQFNNGDYVYARNFTAGPAWIPGKIEVQLEDGRSVRRHIDHLLPRVDDPAGHHTIKMNLSESGESPTAEQPSSSATVEPFPLVDNGSVKESGSLKPEEPATDTTDTTVPLRCSTRI